MLHLKPIINITFINQLPPFPSFSPLRIPSFYTARLLLVFSALSARLRMSARSLRETIRRPEVAQVLQQSEVHRAALVKGLRGAVSGAVSG